MGINHGGSLKVAFKIVDAAKKCGAEIIKHQTIIPDEDMSSESKNIKLKALGEKNLYDLLKKLSLNEEEEYKLKNYVEKKSMIYLSTPFSRAGVDRLVKIGVKLFKIGSGEFSNIPLLKYAAKRCERLGICFHVGSQCLDPTAYKIALQKIKKITCAANISIDIIDVGGGFPSLYPGQEPAPLADYFSEIETALTEISLPNNFEIWCEPGRALVAEAGSIIVHVDARKNDLLYINDGTYGGLFDAGLLGFRYPVKCLRKSGSADLKPFIFYGPTCDSLDVMPGPFMLPSDISEGDYIEIGQTGAYSSALRTPFNGFDKLQEAILEDAPMISMYNSAESATSALNAGKL